MHSLSGDFETAYFEATSTMSNRHDVQTSSKDNPELEELLAKLEDKDVALQAKTAECLSLNQDILVKVCHKEKKELVRSSSAVGHMWQ